MTTTLARGPEGERWAVAISSFTYPNATAVVDDWVQLEGPAAAMPLHQRTDHGEPAARAPLAVGRAGLEPATQGL